MKRNPRFEAGAQRRRRKDAHELSRIFTKLVVRVGPWWSVLVCAVLMAGCAARPERLRVCPGKATVEEALQTLAANAAAAVPMRSRGEAMLAYHVPKKRTTQRQNLLLEVRFNPPAEIYVQGDVSVNPRVVVMGSNREQFWLAMSPPEEVSSYYLGEWSEVQGFEGPMIGISPQVVLEAFGILSEQGSESGSWTLSNKGPFDILTRQDEAGRTLKRVFVYACDYRVYKIEYFDRKGKVIAVAQLGKYEPVTEGFQVPTEMKIVTTTPDGRKDSTEIKLSGQRPTEFNAAQRKKLFTPDPNKYEDIYRYEAGEWLLQ